MDADVDEKTTLTGKSGGQLKCQHHLCPVCGGRFTRPTDLALHIAKIHNIKTDLVDAAPPPAVVQLSLSDSLTDRHIYRHTSPPAVLSVK